MKKDIGICFIDDDPDEHTIFEIALSRIDNQVNFSGFIDAALALEELSAGNIVPDFIFLDLNMPKMTGQQLLLNLKRNITTSKIPVVIYTTSTRQSDKDALLLMGADHFISKPDDINVLQNVLTDLFN